MAENVLCGARHACFHGRSADRLLDRHNRLAAPLDDAIGLVLAITFLSIARVTGPSMPTVRVFIVGLDAPGRPQEDDSVAAPQPLHRLSSYMFYQTP